MLSLSVVMSGVGQKRHGGDRSSYVRFVFQADVNSRKMARTAEENAHP